MVPTYRFRACVVLGLGLVACGGKVAATTAPSGPGNGASGGGAGGDSHGGTSDAAIDSTFGHGGDGGPRFDSGSDSGADDAADPTDAPTNRSPWAGRDGGDGGCVWGLAPPVTIQVTLPEELFTTLRRSPAEMAGELRLAAAVHWCSRGLLSQERAAELAGMDRADLLLALARESS